MVLFGSPVARATSDTPELSELAASARSTENARSIPCTNLPLQITNRVQSRTHKSILFPLIRTFH